MHQASVGFHCPECTKSGAQKVIKASQLVTRPVVTYALIAINVVDLPRRHRLRAPDA